MINNILSEIMPSADSEILNLMCLTVFESKIIWVYEKGTYRTLWGITEVKLILLWKLRMLSTGE